MNGKIVKRGALFNGLVRTMDIVVLVISSVAAYHIRFKNLDIPSDYILFIFALAILTTNIFAFFSIYELSRGKRRLSELTRISFAWAVVIVIIGTLTFITRTGAEFSRIWAGYVFLFSFLGFIFYRELLSILMQNLFSRGFNQKHVVIAGAGKLGSRACKAMKDENWAGLVPIAFFDDNSNLKGTSKLDVPIKGGLSAIVDFIEEQRQSGITPVDQVWITLPLSAQRSIEELQLALQNTATKVYFLPDLYGFDLTSYKVGEAVGLPVMNMSAPLINSTTASLKRVEDIVISSIMIIVLSPVLLVCSCLIRRESPGPILFKQRRYGVNGEEIIVWKFRSMTVSEDGATVTQASRGDKRVTKVGKILRKTSLDELPQLFNVLQGTMSLVGPRPHAVAHNEFYLSKKNTRLHD